MNRIGEMTVCYVAGVDYFYGHKLPLQDVGMVYKQNKGGNLWWPLYFLDLSPCGARGKLQLCSNIFSE